MSSQPQGRPSAGPIDVRGLLDPELGPILGAFEMPPMDADSVAMIRSTPFPAPEVSDAVVRTSTSRRESRPSPCASTVPPASPRRGRPSSRSTAAGTSSAPTSWTTSSTTRGPAAGHRRRLGGLPAGTRDALPGPTRGLLHRPALDPRARGRAGHRPDAYRRLGDQRRRRAGRRAGVVRARPWEFPFAFQLLDCPMLDDRQATPSLAAEGLYVWSAASNKFGWRSYLGDLYGSDDLPPYAAAARAADLAGLPPTCIVVGSIDGFRDEDVDYAAAAQPGRCPV